MAKVTIDCDVVAHNCGKSISHAEVYLAVNKPDHEINYLDGITEATYAYANSELVLYNLEPHQEDERQRFSELRQRALTAIAKFQKRFKVAALPMPNGSVGTLHHTSDEPRKSILNAAKIASNGNGHAERKTRKAYTSRGHLDETKVKEIKRHLSDLRRHYKQADLNELAQIYDVTDQTIRNVADGTSWSHVTI